MSFKLITNFMSGRSNTDTIFINYIFDPVHIGSRVFSEAQIIVRAHVDHPASCSWISMESKN